MVDTTLFGDGDVQPDPDEPLATDAEQIDGYVMRVPCRACGHTHGSIRPSNGQDCVYCNKCDRHCYNAPRSETGRAVRSVSSRPQIKASLRARILERDNYRCFLCGATAKETHLQISHMISVKDGRRHGMTDEQLWSYYNLATWCDECNLGQSGRSVNTWLQFRAFLIWDSDYPQ